MEALETAIAYWEDALAAYRPPPGDILALTVRTYLKSFCFFCELQYDYNVSYLLSPGSNLCHFVINNLLK